MTIRDERAEWRSISPWPLAGFTETRFRTARGNPSAYQDLITYDYQGRYLTQRRLLTRYKYESAYSTKDLYLDYRPEYDDQRFMTQVTNRTVYGTAQLDELAAFTYTFDRAGDRLSNVGNRASSSVTNAAGFSKIQRIDAYGYDTLHRLTQVDYNNTWQTANEDYVYDELGNRVTYSDHRNSITRAYANDKANQYTSIAGYTVTHDDAGNLASQVVNGGGDAYVYTYDCDNRLLKVEHDPTTGGNVTVATFAYDALGRKITAWTQFDVAGSGGDSHTSDLRFYHDGQVEIADYNSDGSLARRFVSGTQYIDERAVLIEGEAGDNGAPVDAETLYYLLQELYTVTGLMKVNGTLTEAHTFDGYGKARLWHYSDGDFNRDGAVNATDQTRFTAALGVSSGIPAADPLADLDLDGDVDLTDSYAFTQIKNGGGALAELFTAATGNPFYFTGRRLYMLETLPESNTDPVANQQLQHNRARHYSPMEGRWLQRDPLPEAKHVARSILPFISAPHGRFAKYIANQDRQWESMLFDYDFGRPTVFVDPVGLASCDYCGPDMTGFFRDLVNSAIAWRMSFGELKSFADSGWLMTNGMNLDWTNAIYHVSDSTGAWVCPTRRCLSTYYLCGECVHDHWIGNFMYGFLSRLLGVSDLVSNAGGQYAQEWPKYSDPPWDRAGYEIARNVYDALRRSSGDLCSLLKSDPGLWRSANDTSVGGGQVIPIPLPIGTWPFPIIIPVGSPFPPPHASNYRWCMRCPYDLAPRERNTFPGGSLGGLWPPANAHPLPRPRYPWWDDPPWIDRDP